MNNVKKSLIHKPEVNPERAGMFKWYNCYICTVFFHGIRFKVKESSAVVRQPFFVCIADC